MSLSVAGVWAVDVWNQTVWADDVWREGEAAAPEVVTGGIRTRKIYPQIEDEEEEDWFEEEIKQALKPKKKLKLHKVDYIDVEQEIANIEMAIEYDKRVKVEKKRGQRKKAFEMLLVNL